MLKASKSHFHLALLHGYVRRQLKRRFHEITLHSEEVLADPAHYPLVLYSNHQSWWDTFLKVPLFLRYRAQYWVMMEEKNLRKLSWFQKCGAFGVDLDDGPDAARNRTESLRYAARLLNAPEAQAERRLLVLYPHGRLVRQSEPWPEFQRGLEGILRLCPKAHAVPIHLNIEFRDQPRPFAHLKIGQAIPASERPDTARLERALKALDPRKVR